MSYGKDYAARLHADVHVAVVRHERMLAGDWIKPGATVIDVDLRRVDAGNGSSRLPRAL